MSFFVRRLSCAILVLVCSVVATAQHPLPAQADRVSDTLDLGAVTKLSGHVPTWAIKANDAGAVSGHLPLRLTFVLARSPERQAAFTQLLEDQQNSASPQYHQWLTPKQVGEVYGPTQHDLDAFTDWLASRQLSIVEVAPSRVFVTVEAPASAVSAALSTSFRYFRVGEKPRLSALAEPSIPAAFAPFVASITGLADLSIKPMHRSGSLPMPPRVDSSSDSPLFSVSGNHFITPGDFATIFDLNSVYKSGITGTGQKVAIIGRSRVAATDISEFETKVGLASNVPNVVIPTTGVDPGLSQDGDQGEATLDVDRVIGTAPGVQADLVISGSAGGYNGIYVAAQYEVQTLLDPVMNISFGACEVYAGPAGVSLWDTLFSQAASEGISVFVSSADSGAATCERQFSTPDGYQFASINYICASSYATCVGATEPNDTADPAKYWSESNSSSLVSALGYIPEGAWNEPLFEDSNGEDHYVDSATGGGASIYVPKPSWQIGLGVPADGARDVPDVSFPGAAHDGYFACYALGGGDCANNRFEYFYGTSADAPAFAAVTALLNQKSGGRQGNLNALLYRTATAAPNAFHDATPTSSGIAGCDVNTPSMCNNSTPSSDDLSGGLAGFSLTTGYDQATGLGSLDVAQFFAAAAPAPNSLAAAQIEVASNTSTISDTQTAIFSAAVSSRTAGIPSGTVQFFANQVPLGGPVQLAGGTATTPSVPFSAAGNYLISATYSGDSAFAPVTSPGIPFTVTGLTPVATVGFASPTVPILTPVALTATVSFSDGSGAVPTGMVRFYLTEGANGGYIATAPLSAGTATTSPLSFPPGNYTITSYYRGDSIYSPSHSSAVSFSPAKITTQIQFYTSSATVGAGGSKSFLVNVIPNYGVHSTAPAPTGSVQLYLNGSSIGPLYRLPSSSSTVQVPSITFTAAGTYSVTATYSGDDYFQPSTAPAYSINVVSTPASYSLSAASSTFEVAAGDSTSNTETVIVSPMLDFAGPVDLKCAVTFNGTGTAQSAPTCSLSPGTVNVLADLGSADTLLSVHTVAPRANLGVAVSQAGKPDFSQSTLRSGKTITTVLALLTLMFPSRRRRQARNMLFLLLASVGVASLCGCGGSSSPAPPAPAPLPGTTPGSYTITITGTTTVSGTPAAAPLTIALTVK